MFNSEFYSMCDELHDSLIFHYGGETGYLLARMQTNVNDLNEAANAAMRGGFEALINAVNAMNDLTGANA